MYDVWACQRASKRDDRKQERQHQNGQRYLYGTQGQVVDGYVPRPFVVFVGRKITVVMMNISVGRRVMSVVTIMNALAVRMRNLGNTDVTFRVHMHMQATELH